MSVLVSGRATRFPPVRLATVLVLSLLLVPSGHAQSLSPDATVWCDPVVEASIPISDAAACARQMYRLAASDTVALKQAHYGSVEVTAWDEDAVAVEMIVIPRRATEESARADLARIGLRRVEGVLQSAGPPDDAPGWWSVAYRVQVPAQTALAIASQNGSIRVADVIGAHRLRSQNGSVQFRLPAATGARLEAATTNGRIDVGFPVMVQGTLSNRLDAVVGDGGPTVRLETQNGDIRIDRVR